MREVVLTSAVRTPIGSFNGSLAGIDANRLGAVVIEEAIRRSGIGKEDVDEVIMGMVLPCGRGQNPARQAAVKAGMPWEVQCLTVNKVCGSGLKSVMLAAQAIQSGDADIIVAGGMENMSAAPYYLDKARFGYRMGPGTINDHMMHDGLWDIVNDFHMGESNELVIDRYRVSREDQDRYALRSHERALGAIREGRFRDQIIPVEVPQKKGEPKLFEVDEHPRETSMEALAKLKPVFKSGGRTTAGNASGIADGAAAVVVMAREKALDLGCPVLATVRSQASAGIDMKFILIAPTLAIPKVLKKEGIRIEDVDLFEINEAFAGSTVTVIRELGIDMDKVNVNGGAIALGHPIGASGARVLTTLIYEMIRQDKKTGLASLCLGGGEAVALIIRRDA
ncbi:MAG TPA: acetyl-CoA C-acetyltransferase [Deltaproteobacteria bacterium]|jgi:acetyl-CoA C-acetyltransferase|nr:acetyl-CoA C-acetyltransferase [Deltaproteobacteria bacterium]HRR22534.1 acetyl-CoA C-acetyltransferase [Desulfomonilia bacterium]HOE72091.1 acetyl-CoA C-acetyltransferase [Deltaproteobacteria bacterium]HON61419.1 acetyl-CoA C-acetyltransferase [Deltaproteobacteria bacterium]HPL85637.1 acetyl-CoA C-acetyltransferase [Deltaproteobacteria bacterium]